MVIVEGGFAWLAPLAWRLDKLFERMRGEVQHLKRKPSDYIREHVWVTTQPMEEPASKSQLLDMMEWIGCGPAAVRLRLPALGLRRSLPSIPPAGLEPDRRKQILTANAKAVYRLP